MSILLFTITEATSAEIQIRGKKKCYMRIIIGRNLSHKFHFIEFCFKGSFVSASCKLFK